MDPEAICYRCKKDMNWFLLCHECDRVNVNSCIHCCKDDGCAGVTLLNDFVYISWEYRSREYHSRRRRCHLR